VDTAAHTATEVVGFFAYAPQFAGGVRVAAADFDGGGIARVVTGAGPGGGPHVRAFQVAAGSVTATLSLFAYDPGFTGGVFVSGAGP
jgi:hypothetical protein